MNKMRGCTAEEARLKALECIEMAKHSKLDRHRIMLEHIAKTWERIAVDIDKQNH